jgi:hypothetical protein
VQNPSAVERRQIEEEDSKRERGREREREREWAKTDKDLEELIEIERQREIKTMLTHDGRLATRGSQQKRGRGGRRGGEERRRSSKKSSWSSRQGIAGVGSY